MLMLRNHQRFDLLYLINHVKNNTTNQIILAIIYATGSGKSLMIGGLCESLIRVSKLYTHAVIVTPQNLLKESFRPSDFELDGHIIQPRFEKSVNGETLIRKLGCSGACEKIIVTTHNMLGRLLADLQHMARIVPGFARGKILVVDEGHHVGDRTLLKRVTDLWKTNGGLLVYATASPNRSNGECVIPECSITVTRTLHEQMMDGYAPGKLTSAWVPVDSIAHTVGSEGEVWRHVPVDVDKLIEKIREEWVNNGYPKTILRFCHGQTESANTLFFEKLLHGLGDIALDLGDNSKKANIISAYGKQTQLQDLLKIDFEKNSYTDLTVDFIAGIVRVTEGLDWAVCSNVYMVGVPSSTLTFLQAMGRGTRCKFEEENGIVTDKPKWAGYPARWLDETKLTLFVGNVDDISDEHKRHVLKLMCLIASYKYHGVWEIFRGLSSLDIGGGKETEKIRAILPSEEEQADIHALMVSVKIRWEATAKPWDEPLTYRNYYELIKYFTEDDDKDKLLRRKVFFVFHAMNKTASKVINSVQSHVARTQNTDLISAIDALILKDENEAMSDSIAQLEEDILQHGGSLSITKEDITKYVGLIESSLNKIELTKSYGYSRWSYNAHPLVV